MSREEMRVGAWGPLTLSWAGRVATGAFFATGTSHLFPIPPSILQGLQAMFLCMAGMVLLSMAEFIAFYLAMLAALSTDNTQTQLKVATQLQRRVATVFSDSAVALKKIYQATVGRFGKSKDSKDS